MNQEKSSKRKGGFEIAKKPKHGKSDTNCNFCGIIHRTQSTKKHKIFCRMRSSWKILEADKNVSIESVMIQTYK